MNIIFFGTPDFGAVILEGLIKNYKPVLVITEPNKPTGRKQTLTPPPVKVLAQKYNLPVLQPEKIRNLELEIRNLSPDIIITASYGQILPKEILDIPKYGCLNIHPSLLPKYRGSSPIQTAILNGDKETGISIILMNEKIDAGPIVASSKYTPLSNMNHKELEEELAEAGLGLLLKTIPKWINGEIKPMPQDESKATYTTTLTREDGKIDWSKSADEIERQIRAFCPWPGVFTSLKLKTQNSKRKTTAQNLKLKILEASIEKDGTDKQPGEVFLTKDGKIAVRAGQNCLILQRLQLEGKKPMLAEDFLHGHPEFIGTILK
jgi:methionyl-tRNA formyltransferase